MKSLINPSFPKFCSQCSDFKSSLDFGKNKTNKDGRARLCKICTNTNKRAWSQKNRPSLSAKNLAWKKKNLSKARNTNLNTKYRSRYGISLNEFKEMCLRQHNLCAICYSFSKLCVDHNHLTGKIRGLLCGPCNRAIGCLKDSSKFAANAALYLSKNGN